VSSIVCAFEGNVTINTYKYISDSVVSVNSSLSQLKIKLIRSQKKKNDLKGGAEERERTGESGPLAPLSMRI
jgi:hypothetical protein